MVNAMPPPTNGVNTQTATICWYFQTGVPPRARPTPMTAPVTVNAVAIGLVETLRF